jgi:hypothetical protein
MIVRECSEIGFQDDIDEISEIQNIQPHFASDTLAGFLIYLDFGTIAGKFIPISPIKYASSWSRY